MLRATRSRVLAACAGLVRRALREEHLRVRIRVRCEQRVRLRNRFFYQLDGTEVKFTLPTCLPTACRAEIEEGGASRLHHRGRNTSDLLAIQACMQRHTCEGSSELRRLVPECKVTLSCLDEQEIADLTVWLILGFVGALAFTSLALKAGVLSCCWRKQRKRTKEEQEELNFFVGAAHEESPNNLSAPLLNEQSSGGSVQSQASRFVLSEDLRDNKTQAGSHWVDEDLGRHTPRFHQTQNHLK